MPGPAGSQAGRFSVLSEPGRQGCSDMFVTGRAFHSPVFLHQTHMLRAAISERGTVGNNIETHLCPMMKSGDHKADF